MRNANLRTRASDRLGAPTPASLAEVAELSPEAAGRLLHELQVHQVELEIQNEDLRATQVSLDRLREKYFDLYDQAPVGYATVSEPGLILEANQTLARLLYRSSHELLGQPLTRFVDRQDQDGIYHLLKDLRDRGSALPAALRLLRSGQPSFWARINSLSVPDPEEGRTFRLVVTDITQERAMEETVRLADKLDALESLAGGVAHDFNNLLGGIFGYITLARDLGRATPEVVRYLDKADQVFGRARALTHQLLTFTKENTPRRQPVDLALLVERNTAFVLAGTNVASRTTVAGKLPPAFVDENQLGQVLDNLVLNAVQAMPRGGVVSLDLRLAPAATLECRRPSPGSFLELTVSDQGQGIPAAILGRVFDPFFTTKPTGHGLGLATCHSILGKHGGTIWAESVEGQGTSFHVLVPVATRETFEAAVSLVPDHRGAGTILVMDDEAFFREILHAFLAAMGYSVIEAAGGDEALALAAAGVPLRAAILDLTVPGGRGGKDTIGPLRDRFPGLPVFAISGFSEDPIIARPQDFGFTASLQKPFAREDLVRLLDASLRPDRLTGGSSS